ncbi:hypothetical protein [Mycoplasma putrefaciens]|uniref:Uncharacterized protein n=1 Tax=Mycoplasma putrefaciens (strain ATCC 15718 / NCTC 10155 / C30 KS-1 / KS-1) TaxID=743965 RepID=A0A7U3ZSP5_MYCPK|nr:hypothetical protein [Mycoplasma putrefaciens]AEM68803.1 uncharacterized protein MPUT_0430 [Mycoplasma putrefaciens KS1]
MVEIYKLKELNSSDLKAYSHINPWFEKRLNTLIIKNKKWIRNFGLNPNDYINFDDISFVSLDKAFKAINNYLNFFKPRVKKIISDKRLFKKFDQAIKNYVSLLAMCQAINTMIDFYLKMDYEIILNKQQTAYQLANQILNDKFERFSNEVLKIIPNEYKNNLKDLYNEKQDFANQLLNSSKFSSWTAKYAKALFSNNKIRETEFLKIIYFCYLEDEFNRSYSILLQEFIYKLN